MIDVKATTIVIGELAELVRDYEARIATIDDDAQDIIFNALKLNTECLSDEGLDAVIDAIRNAYVEIRDTSIATIAEQSRYLSEAIKENDKTSTPAIKGRGACLVCGAD